MKKVLFLFLSSFAFGQNIEVLKMMQTGDKNTPENLSKQIIPGFKFVHSYHIDTRNGEEYNYEYLPATTSEENLKAFLSSTYDYSAIDEIKTIFVENRSVYKLRSIVGKCENLVPIWTKYVNPQTKIEDSGEYEYQDNANTINLILFYDALSNQCSIENQNVYK